MVDVYPGWDRFQVVNVDLSGLTGTPGIDSDEAFVAEVERSVGGPAHNAGEENAPFIVAAAPEPLSEGPVPALGFLGAGSGFLETEAAPTESTGAKRMAENTTPSGIHLLARQEIRGVEVVGCRFGIHYRPGDTRFAITGRPATDLTDRDPGPRPAASIADATAAVFERFSLPAGNRVEVKEVVFPHGDGAVWAFECRIPLETEPVDLRAYVGARDMELLFSYNVACAALHGEAKVFPVNPRRTTGLLPVPLFDIGPEPPDQLRGKVFEVVPHRGDPFRHPGRDCRLEPGDPGFDQVQAWYHLGHAVNFFRLLVRPDLFSNSPFAPLRVTVNDGRSPNNAFFRPDLGELWFGDFGPHPSARSGDVVFHELSHAVSDATCALARAPLGHPARGLSEGYADYFAASALDDPRVGDYVAGRDEGARRLDKEGLSMAAVADASEHRQGEVWGAILWSIRKDLGAPLTDLLAAESLHYLGPHAGYAEGVAALLEADRVLFPADEGQGRHHDAIQTQFSARR